jgi:hypothetical protein
MIFGVHHDCMIKDKTIRGPSFCHVDKIKQFIHDKDAITDGNQKWQGAIPSFNSNAMIII